MSDDIIYPKRPGSGKVLAGLILLAVGGLLLLRELTPIFFPDWIFSFPMLLIVIGLYTGAKHNFRNSGWIILVLLGVVFLSDHIIIGAAHFMWPLAIILFGVWLIVGRHHKYDNDWKSHLQYKVKKKNWEWEQTTWTATEPNPEASDPVSAEWATERNRSYSEDFIDVTSVFGNTKKMVLSKNFKGGDIVNVFGGVDLNLSQADINGRVIIDVTQFFGGIKLIVPPHWQVVPDVASVFAGIEDKRKSGITQMSEDKILIITGTSVFAGIEIRSF